MSHYTTLPEALAGILAQDLTMQEALGAYAHELDQLNPEIAAAYEELVARLRGAEAGASAPRLGDRLPDFVLTDQDGRLRGLQDFLGKGPLIVSLNRGHWCPFCRIELSALAKAHARLERAGAAALSIMPDRQPFTTLVRERGFPFPVLTDIDGAYALELGLCFYIGDELVRVFRQSGHQMPIFQGNDSWFLPIPATFVLDGAGRILARLVDADFRFNRMAVEEIASVVEAAALAAK